MTRDGKSEREKKEEEEEEADEGVEHSYSPFSSAFYVHDLWNFNVLTNKLRG